MQILCKFIQMFQNFLFQISIFNLEQAYNNFIKIQQIYHLINKKCYKSISIPYINKQPLKMLRPLLYLFLFLTYITLTSSSQQCFKRRPSSASNEGPLKLSITDPIKDFESGSYTIVNSNLQKPQRYTCFNITFMYINGKNSYEVVASIKNIDNYQDKEGLDFSVRFAQNPTVIEGLFIMAKSAIWTSVNIHYLITAREDFRVGTFVPETTQFLPCGKQSSDLIIYHKIIKPWNASQKLIFGLPFLSGIRTLDNEITINFNKSTFNPRDSLFQIPVKFSQVQYPIEYLLVSYLIVTMDSDFQITNIYDLNYIPADINVFVGMTGVKTAPEIVAVLGVLKTATSSTVVANKNKFHEFFQVQGLVIQSQTNLDLLFSDGKVLTDQTIQCITAERCQGYDGYMKYYQNQGGFVFHSECVLCEKFASYNQITQKCECRELYTRVNNECVIKNKSCASVLQIYNNTTEKCECKAGYVLKEGKCCLLTVCPPGFSNFKGTCFRINFNTKKTTVASNKTQPQVKSATSTVSAPVPAQVPAPVPVPTIVNEKVPTCLQNLVWNPISKTCECPLNSFYDNVNKNCVFCKINQIWDDSKKACSCISGSFNINGNCQFCDKSAFYNGKSCQCLPGYLGDGKICKQDINFKEDQALGLVFQNLGNQQNKDSQNLAKQPENNPNTGQSVVLGIIQIN